MCCSVLSAAVANALPSRQLEVRTGIGQLGEDTLLDAQLALYLFDEVKGVTCGEATYESLSETCSAPVRAFIQVPLRFEIIDEEPSDSAFLREEDWDDPGDFFRIARLLEYGRPHDPFHARLGELGGLVLGHGTLVNGYNNNITTDDFRPGAELHANTAYGGIHAAIDDVTAPHLLAMRGFVRPWGFSSTDSWWHRLAIGASAVSDFAAPTRLRDCEDCEVGFYTRPPVEEATALTFAGVDLEVSIVDEGMWRVLPYIDGNIGTGVGGHLGLALALAPTEDLEFGLRLEGRAFRDGYLPDYFGPLYEVQRYRMSGWGSPIAAPRARVAASRSESGYGGFGQLVVALRHYGSLAVAASEHDGSGDTSVWARLSVAPPAPVSFGAYVASIDTDRESLFDLDGTLVVTEGRVDVWGPLFVQGRLDRLWRLSTAGQYVATTEWSTGIGAAFEL